jgi:NTP pyrophosphatase (non-canonical NTP hydrolase)
MKWTQVSITGWSTQTFGNRTALATAVRANKEMAELLSALENGEDEVARKEVADVVIVLMQVAQRLNIDLDAEIQRKMEINEKRNWRKMEDGSFQHV